jgi:hypothetical protein
VLPGATRAAVGEGAGEAATTAAVTEGAGTAGAAADVAVAGGAAEIAGIALAVVAEQVIIIAIGLLIEWLKGLFEQSLLESDTRALGPQIQAALRKLGPQITGLQQHGKVYGRITLDVSRRVGHAFEQGFPATWDYYEGVSLGPVHVAGQSAPSVHSEREEPLSANEARTHYVQSFSILLDDPQRRAQEQERARLIEKLRRSAVKAPPPPAQPQPPQQAPPLLPSPGPPQPEPKFEPLPGAPGPSPQREAQAIAMYYKKWALSLLAVGEKLVSSSPNRADIDAFLHAEDQWRTAARLVDLEFITKGPAVGHSGTSEFTGMDELLKGDKYGGRLLQIRRNLGG